MGLLPIEEEIDGFAHALIVDLTVEILINHLGPLLRRDVGQNVRGGVSRLVDIGGGPQIAAGVGQHGRQPRQYMGLHIAHRGVGGVQLVAVEHVYGGADHLQVAELLRRHVEEQILNFRILDPHTLGQVL